MASDLDAFLQTLGDPGRYQCFVCLLLLFNVFPLAFHNLNMVFMGTTPPHHCKVPINQTLNDTIPTLEKNGKIQYQQCVMYSNPINKSEGIIPCTDGWTYLYEENEWTIVGEWDLVCDRKWLVGFVTTAYFGGTLLGSPVLGTLADKRGRKPVFLGCIYCGVVIGVIQFFSNSYVMFALLRLLHGCVIQGMINASASINMELFRKEHRTEAAIAANIIWTLAQFVLTFFAYLTPHWRYLYLFTSLPSLVAVSYIWLVPESLRWLLVQNKVEEAKIVAKKYAKMNKIQLDSNFDKQITNLAHNLANSELGVSNKYDFRDLFRTKYIRRTTILTVYMWFSASVVYYGINFSLPALGGNKYINFLISAGVELGSRAFLYPALKFTGRKLPNAIAFLLSGILCIASALIDNYVTSDVFNVKWVAIGCALVGKATCSISFACVILLTSELLPTVIRGVALGVCGLANRIGGMSAPQILLLGDYVSHALPLVSFGVAAIIAAVITWSLPETRNLSLPDTIEDSENLYAKKKKCSDQKQENGSVGANAVSTDNLKMENVINDEKGIKNLSYNNE